ncbi:serine hydrolase [Alkalinema pantanalense CENA528]|uniref:serine hydrolase n=1 Tax=Alkalinema pantanalense TaxID=1620705 RepID=UPI003D6FA179
MQRRTIASAITLGYLLCLGTFSPSALASSIDDPNSIDWASIRGYSSQAFHTYFNQKKADGYRIVDLEVDEINGKASYSAIWQKNTDQRGWISLRDLTDNEFSQKWQENRDKGYRLIDQEAYTLNGKRFYAGVWIENVEKTNWVSYRNVDGAEFGQRFKQYSDQGYRMISLDAYGSGNQPLYAAIWVKNTDNTDWLENRDMSETTYADKFKTLSQQGYRVLDFESYQRNGQQQYAAIWVKNNGRGWKTRRDLTANEFGNWWKTYNDEGYRLVDFEAYATPQGTRYAGVWRQNNDRANWAPKNAIDNAIEAYQDKFKVPGMSVAIAQNGKLVYTRGFGYADIAKQKVAHAGTVFRLASVSKPITAALMMRLVEQGRLDLDQASRTYVPTLPKHHTHTVRQLFKHQAGIRHYRGSQRKDCIVPNNSDWKDSSSTQYATATAATALFRDDPLMFSPGTKSCYSTHGYTILGATMESAAKVSFATLIDRELAKGLNLPTLQLEVLSQPHPERATLYKTKDDINDANVPAAWDNISWKGPGGGMIASSVDLALFGARLSDGSLLSQQKREELWKTTLSFSGAQNGAQSHLRVYFNEGLVISVLSNQQINLDKDDPEKDELGPGNLASTLASIIRK